MAEALCGAIAGKQNFPQMGQLAAAQLRRKVLQARTHARGLHAAVQRLLASELIDPLSPRKPADVLVSCPEVLRFAIHLITIASMGPRALRAMHIRSLVEALKADGHEVTIVSPPGVDPLKSAGMMPFLRKEDRARGLQRIWKYISCECPQLIFEVFELFYNLFLPFRLLPVLLRRPNAVLYERHAYFMFMGVLLGNWLKRPVILEVNELAGFARSRGLILERLARSIDAWVFSHSTHILVRFHRVLALEALQRGAGSESRRPHVLPNAQW